MKTLEDEWYMVMKAYKFTIFEILRDFFFGIITYCMYVLSLHVESTNSMMQFGIPTMVNNIVALMKFSRY